MKTGITSGATGTDVGEVQSALAAAGFAIDASEVASQTFGPSTLAALNGFQQQKKLTVGSVVDAATAASLAAVAPLAAGTGVTAAVQGTVVTKPNATITGTLVDGDGAPVASTKVSLFSEALRLETHVADATTDVNGAYSIAYVRPSALNLLVRAYDAQGTAIATSPTAFAAATPIEIDLTTATDGVIRAPSTFTTLSASVTSVLQKVALTDLKENSTAHEVLFVANASGVAFASVAQLYVASVIAAQQKLRADTVFGIFSQGIPATLGTQLANLPATGLDATFAAQTFADVLAHSRGALAAALTAAVAADIVPASYAQVQSAQLDLIDSLRTTSVSAAPFGQTTTSLSDLLAAGSVSAAATTAFTAAYAANGGDVTAALQTVQSNSSVSAADLATLTNTVELSPLLAGNGPLVKDSMQRIAQKTLASVSDLALLSASDWSARISAVDPQATSIPPVTTGETAAQKIARFSSQLAQQLAAAYPTTAFRAGLASAQQSAFTTKSELVQVLGANPTLDLLHVVIDQVVATNNTNKVTISAPALAELKTAQRLMKLTPVYANVEALKSAGFQSAQSIYVTGRAAFVSKMTPALGAATAQLVFATAQMTYATAVTTWAQYNGAFNSVGFKALPATTLPAADATTAQLPDIQALFGSQSYFECEDCQSVLSPAAYLVDLLQYLQQFTATLLTSPPLPTLPNPPATPWPATTTAYQALVDRRPEIPYIALDCTNTNVTIPYIDLVNEILEAFITSTKPTAPIETSGTAAERRAMPQSINAAAYAPMLSAVFPFTLPFDVAFALTTAYLAAMGISHRDLLAKLHAPAAAIAGAALGINPELQNVIIGNEPTSTSTHQPMERWGYPTTETGWMSELAAAGGVPTLLRKSGLALQQLYQLLEVQWVVTTSNVTLSLGTTTTTNGVKVVSADLGAMTFANLTADVLDRAQRFIRLWTASGLQMWDLDWALAATTPKLTASSATLDLAFLEFLNGAIAVAAKLKLPLQEVLTFWAPLETRDVTSHLGDEDAVVPSTFTSVFGNAPLLAAYPGVFVISTTGDLNGQDILPSGTDLNTNLNAVTAALGLGGDDIQAILTATGAGRTLTLATLAVLFRYARLARALSLSITDLLTWMQLAGDATSVTIGTTPADTLELLHRIAVLRGTGLAVADADYLLRGSSAAQSSVVFTIQQCSTLLQSIRDAVGKLTSAQQTTPDTATIDTITIAALATATSTTTNVIAPLFKYTPDATLDATTITALVATLTPPTPPATPPPFDPTQFPKLVTAFTAIARGAALYTALHATEAELACVVTNASVFGWLDPAMLPISATSPYAAFEALLRALKLNRRQAARTPRLFDVLAAWQSAPTLPGLGDAIAGTATLPSLAVALGSNATDVTALATPFGATAPSLTAITGTLCDVATLTALAEAIDLAARYSLSGATLVQLGGPMPDQSTVAGATAAAALASAARGAFQAQYPQSQWLAAIQSVEDELRQTRRAALVAYLFNPGAPQPTLFTFASTDDVFDYFLIDPEMCSCSTTTRLLQASLAIQQFVQQAFLGLPIQYKIDTSSSGAVQQAWSEWSWRQQYRLWQANREVFLYPENYLAPELRTDASPLFESLESDLRQNNCDADLAQTAFENYVRGLVAASNLVVAAHYSETRVSNGAQVLYVFAHTRGTPYQWSYRTRTTPSTDALGAWSAWQPLGLDIPSDQVVPVVWDQRLHLVWPIFSIISEQAQVQTVPSVTSGTPDPSSNPPATTFWTIQFAISEFSAGQWQAKRVLDEKMFFTRTAPPDAGDLYINRPADAFTFRASVDATNTLTISAYYNIANQEQKVRRLNSSTGDLFNFGTSIYNVGTGNTKVGTATLPSLEAPLAVVQISPPTPSTSGLLLTPLAGDIDLSQEPTFALVQEASPLPGTLAVPTGYNFYGQELISGEYDHPATGTVALNVLVPSNTLAATATPQALLGQIVAPRAVVTPREIATTSTDWFFVSDSGGGGSTSPRPARTYLVYSPGAMQAPTTTVNGSQLAQNTPELFIVSRPAVPQLTFQTFYHPFARTMLRELEGNGIAGLMARCLQTTPQTTRGWSFTFKDTFAPTPLVAIPYPGQPGASDIGESGLDFSVGSSGAYSLYNWEIFYHAPMFVAELLMQNQQYSDAMAWLEYIFNPSDTSSYTTPQRFWQTQPLFAMTGDDWSAQQIQTLLTNAAAGVVDPANATAIQNYIHDPFDPDAIASLRIAAYGKATVMKFLDNLIAWGDSLFTTYTAETVNQAEQLYILADLILGDRPTEVRMPPQPAAQPPTYTSIQSELATDSLNDPLVAVENLVVAPTPPQALVDGTSTTTLPGTADTLLFCIPPNSKMLAYWDTVADRLYKIRHCLNLQGQAVPLPLYAPPINPLLATQAAAAGQIAGAMTVQPTLYRFATYLQRALDLTNDVRQYGSLILSALEKEDAETLALLRATQEVDIQQRLLDVKTRQVTEATDQITALQNQKAIAQIRYNFYSTIAFMNEWETNATSSQTQALNRNSLASKIEDGVALSFLIPLLEFGAAGFGGAPYATGSYGGTNLAEAARASATALHSDAAVISEQAGMTATQGSYHRRADDWQLQANLAQAELTQIDSQITAATDRLAIAQSELAIQSETIANAQAIQTFLTNKYTNADLYDWMVSQLTTVFTQAYQLAYSLAQQAQTAYQFELGVSTTFIQLNYWDAQHRGLTAGESLLFDLRRMEAQYLSDNIREQELIKHVSLALTQPCALITLQQTGTCQIVLDESLFDADHPGHYFRRLRDVAVTVPFVGGPYTGANGQLTLMTSVIRTSKDISTTSYTPATAASPSGWNLVPPTSFQPYGDGTTTISTSNGQHDSGLFEVNLHDERFLPFEGRGAISQWSLELHPEDNAFDFSTITDIVLHVRYTARLGIDAATVRKTVPTARSIYISAKATFGEAYYAFLNPAAGATQQVLTLPLAQTQFPFSNLGVPTLDSVAVYVALATPPGSTPALPATFGPSASTTPTGIQLAPSPTSPTGDGIAMLWTQTPVAATGGIPQAFALTVPIATIPTVLQAANGQLDPTKIDDIVLVIKYTI